MGLTGPSSAGYHRTANFMDCPQKFAYRWVLGFRTKVEGDATGLGTTLHEALRSHYMGEPVDEACLAFELDRRYSRFIDSAMDLYRRYIKHYPVEAWKVLDAEREIEVHLHEHRLTRRLDLIVAHKGAVWVVDHKTAGRVASRIRGAPLDWSLATQETVGAAVLPGMYGLPWGGVILNVIGTGSSGPEFRRQVIRFPSSFLEAIPRSLYWYLQRIAALESTDPWAYPRSGACESRYGLCEYYDLCKFGQVAQCQFDVVKGV